MTKDETGELRREWLEEFQDESDRACAVLGAAFLAQQLRDLLEAYFVDDPSRVKKLFNGAASPLSSFSARIDLTYALGFLDPREFRDLHLVRKIRNDFAHQLAGVTFDTENVASRCAELESCNVVGESFEALKRSRNRFTFSVVLIAQWLSLKRIGIRDSRRTIPPVKEWTS